MIEPDEIIIGRTSLTEILERHQHWLNKDCDGWEDMRACLRGVDLSGTDLRSVNLRNADLFRTIFYCADLRNADLRYANLQSADLSCANLSGADLGGADIRGAILNLIVYRNAKGLPKNWILITRRKKKNGN